MVIWKVGRDGMTGMDDPSLPGGWTILAIWKVGKEVMTEMDDPTLPGAGPYWSSGRWVEMG